MQMPGRHGNTSDYRYGFQGQETDDEITWSESHVSYKYRMHDARLGRFLSLDPLAPDYPHNSPYAFSENKVIAYVELEGLEIGPSGAGIPVGSPGFTDGMDLNSDQSTGSTSSTPAIDEQSNEVEVGPITFLMTMFGTTALEQDGYSEEVVSDYFVAQATGNDYKIPEKPEVELSPQVVIDMITNGQGYGLEKVTPAAYVFSISGSFTPGAGRGAGLDFVIFDRGPYKGTFPTIVQSTDVWSAGWDMTAGLDAQVVWFTGEDKFLTPSLWQSTPFDYSTVTHNVGTDFAIGVLKLGPIGSFSKSEHGLLIGVGMTYGWGIGGWSASASEGNVLYAPTLKPTIK
jgi:RHS repeat-associated protein